MDLPLVLLQCLRRAEAAIGLALTNKLIGMLGVERKPFGLRRVVSLP
jgi:hypothetical protein